MSKERRLTENDIRRFWSKVRKLASGCWEWTGSVDGKGYGLFHVKLERRHLMKSHRVGYAQVKGDIQDGLVIDHLCRNRRCVNPEHLEAVTNRENTLRGIFPNQLKTHCPQGHKYTEENTYRYKRERLCRECLRIRHREWSRNLPRERKDAINRKQNERRYKNGTRSKRLSLARRTETV